MDELSKLEVLVGEWSVHVPGAGDVKAGATFEWLEGGGFLIQRSTVDRPEFPNGVMVIGATGPDGGLEQHYFDSRGVHRVYDMTLEDGAWTLSREGPDWPQRYVGQISDDGHEIHGRWERGETLGDPLKLDFELNYKRVR
jgi:hypothetical protein